VNDANGWTPLCYALFGWLREVARFLIAIGAKAGKAQVDVAALAMYNGERNPVDLVLVGSKTDDAVYKPATTRFATGKNHINEIVVPQGTKTFCSMHRSSLLR
jgi:hypothetical protein